MSYGDNCDEWGVYAWQVYMKGLNGLALCSMQYVAKLALIVCLLGLKYFQ